LDLKRRFVNDMFGVAEEFRMSSGVKRRKKQFFLEWLGCYFVLAILAVKSKKKRCLITPLNKKIYFIVNLCRLKYLIG